MDYRAHDPRFCELWSVQQSFIMPLQQWCEEIYGQYYGSSIRRGKNTYALLDDHNIDSITEVAFVEEVKHLICQIMMLTVLQKKQHV